MPQCFKLLYLSIAIPAITEKIIALNGRAIPVTDTSSQVIRKYEIFTVDGLDYL